MKFGLIELYVDLEGITAESAPVAVLKGIIRDSEDDRRESTVRKAVEKAAACGCEFLILPGWTVVAREPPDWLEKLSRNRTVVFECLVPQAHRRAANPVSFVLQNSQIVVGPATQRAAQSYDFWTGNLLSDPARQLINELLSSGPEGRRWAIPKLGEAMLLLCGETNFVAGGGPNPKCWNYEAVNDMGLTAKNLKDVRVIANPSHTWSKPQASRDKRAWLSRGGLLLNTANTHSGGWSWERERGVAQGLASYSAARAWSREKECALNREASEDDYVLMTLDWQP